MAQTQTGSSLMRSRKHGPVALRSCSPLWARVLFCATSANTAKLCLVQDSGGVRGADGRPAPGQGTHPIGLGRGHSPRPWGLLARTVTPQGRDRPCVWGNERVCPQNPGDWRKRRVRVSGRGPGSRHPCDMPVFPSQEYLSGCVPHKHLASWAQETGIHCSQGSPVIA